MFSTLRTIYASIGTSKDMSYPPPGGYPGYGPPGGSPYTAAPAGPALGFDNLGNPAPVGPPGGYPGVSLLTGYTL